MTEEMEAEYIFWKCVASIKCISEVETWSLADMEKFCAFEDMQSDYSRAFEEAARPKG